MVQMKTIVYTLRHWTKEWCKWRPQYTLNNLTTNWRLSEPNDYKIFCGWIACHLLRYSRLLPLQSLKEIRARTRHSERLSITHGYLATGNGFEDLKFIHATCSQVIGDTFTAWQTDGNWINIARYCPQTIQYTDMRSWTTMDTFWEMRG
jgi:hypothetical protein